MQYLDRLAEAADGDGWTLSLLPLGSVTITTGKVSISDPTGATPRSHDLAAGEYPVQVVVLAPEGQPNARQVAAVLVEAGPGRPAAWEAAGSVELGELICVCDADLRYRIEEWEEDGRYQISFLEDVAVPALMERGRWRMGARARFEDQTILLAQNSHVPGEYPIWKGLDGAGQILCYLLDLGLLTEG